MYKWGSYFLLEKSVAIFLKLAENENFNKIASLPVRGEDQNENIFFPHLFPFSETRNSELLLLQRISTGVAEEVNGAEF